MIHLRPEIEKAARQVALKTNDLLRDRSQQASYLVRGCLIHTQLQVIFDMKFGSRLQQVIHEMMVTHATKAEQMGPGAFDGTVREVVRGLLQPDGLTIHRSVHESLKANLGRRPCRRDIDWLVERFGISRPALFRKSLLSAGFAGRVVIEKSRGSEPIVEVVRGYAFDAASALSIPSTKLSNPRVACVDGYVETVGEIHHFLEGASEAKEPAVLFVRGLSDEVKHTLKVNYDRGSLKVIPVIVKFDLEGINTLADVCVASGADLVSSSKGDLISSMLFDRCPVVEHVVVYSDRVIIVNNRTARGVAAQVKELCRRRVKATDETMCELLDARVRSLCPSYVVIRLPDDQNFVVDSQSLDYGLRAYSRMVDHGVTMEGPKELAVTVAAVEAYSSRCLESIRGLGAAFIT